jgi:hypothetical protein
MMMGLLLAVYAVVELVAGPILLLATIWVVSRYLWGLLSVPLLRLGRFVRSPKEVSKTLRRIPWKVCFPALPAALFLIGWVVYWPLAKLWLVIRWVARGIPPAVTWIARALDWLGTMTLCVCCLLAWLLSVAPVLVGDRLEEALKTSGLEVEGVSPLTCQECSQATDGCPDATAHCVSCQERQLSNLALAGSWPDAG